MNNHYSLPLCTPSRAALLTGKYPIHTGMHQNLILEAEPWGLPLEEKLLPEYLSHLGYTNYAIGKWHLGFFKKAYTPTERGFTKHFGFWNGYQDYYSHNVQASFVSYEGFDMRRNLEAAYDTRGHYSTDLFTDEAVNIIKSHNVNNSSLFLYLSHLAPHAGNYENPLQAPSQTIQKFRCIKNLKRRLYAAMVTKLDESVGRVMEALQQKGILNNTVVIFVSDNGAASDGIHPNYGSNWPLKGMKGTPWEGSSRTVALIWSNSLKKKRRISNQLIHITDWLPTLYSAAGGEASKLTNIDGFDMWEAISESLPSPRNKFLINIDPSSGYSALRLGKYKYINGTTLFGNLDTWSAKPDIEDNNCPRYHEKQILESQAAYAISSISKLITRNEILNLRQQASINCKIPSGHITPCTPLEQPCIFDIELDPCEIQNLYNTEKDFHGVFEAELANYTEYMVQPLNRRADKMANPKYWNNTWTYWKDLSRPTELD